MTSDNKYIISCSLDKTIRVWNILEKRQEAVLQENLNGVNSLTVTSDNKYAVTGSLDKTIRIWNLFEKRQEAVFEGHLDGAVSDKRQQICYFWLERQDNKSLKSF